MQILLRRSKMQEEKSKPKFTLDKPMFKKLYKLNKSRNGKTTFSRKQIGYLVAGVLDGSVTLGYSLCHRLDEYDVVDGEKKPHWGRSMAINRALKWSGDNLIQIPHSIFSEACKFTERCNKYYKDKDVPRIMPQPQDNHTEGLQVLIRTRRDDPFPNPKTEEV
jgi:hypothetical protein